MKIFLRFKLLFANHLLLIILLIAAFFRFYGLNWDQGYYLHPDERMVVMVSERLHWDSLNPKFFAYGSFPFYLLRVVSFITSQFLGQQWTTYSHLYLVGRVLSVFFDLGTILLLFKIGEKVFSPKIALTASFFYALCVLPIQLSHFYAVDVVLNFFIFLTLYRLILFYETQTFKQATFVGISFGLALATKVSATALVISIGTALIFDHFLVLLKRWRKTFSPWWRKVFFFLKPSKKRALVQIIKALLGYGLITSFSTLVTFVVFEPYALIDFPTFWQQISRQHQMTKDAFVFPYTLQYVDTPPYWYHLKNLLLWGMGIGLGSLSIVGSGLYLFSLLKRIKAKGEEDVEAKEIILVVFFLVYFLIVGQFAVKFMRYWLPLYPLFCLFAAWSLQTLTRSLKKIVSFFVFLTTLSWVLAFTAVYSKANTRLLATHWINQNVPAGAKIAVEHWDDRVPLWGKYQFLEMPMYDPDDSELKWKQIRQNLKEADYLVLASNRLYKPLMKLSDCQKYKICYPKTAKYYQRLFNEKLGFRKIAEFTVYPQLAVGRWLLVIRDQEADESFTVYDHPKVIIFKKDESGVYFKN